MYFVNSWLPRETQHMGLAHLLSGSGAYNTVEHREVKGPFLLRSASY